MYVYVVFEAELLLLLLLLSSGRSSLVSMVEVSLLEKEISLLHLPQPIGPNLFFFHCQPLMSRLTDFMQLGKSAKQGRKKEIEGQ